ncbi:MAG: hypothetical protein ACRDD8_00140 [Bacteroidales bacterium]
MKTIWKIIIFIGVLLSIIMIRTFTFTPVLSDKTSEFCSQIARHNKIDWSDSDVSSNQTPGLQILTNLSSVVTNNEICELSKSLIPVQRAYAAYLAKSNSVSNIEPLILQHLNDAAEVELQIANVKSRNKVGDIYLETLFPKLEPVQQNRIDSLLIFNRNNKLRFRKEALDRQAGNRIFYERIREICKVEPAKENYIHLAKYQQEQDVTLLKRELKKIYSKNLNYILEAVTVFPHPQFLPLLMDVFGYVEKEKLPKHINPDLLFGALLQYKDPTVFSKLQHVLINGERLYPEPFVSAAYTAIQKANSEYYLPLCTIKENTVMQ